MKKTEFQDLININKTLHSVNKYTQGGSSWEMRYLGPGPGSSTKVLCGFGSEPLWHQCPLDIEGLGSQVLSTLLALPSLVGVFLADL